MIREFAQRANTAPRSPQACARGRVYPVVEENGRPCGDEAEVEDRNHPPGDFTSRELREDTARFLDELRRRAEAKRRRDPRRKPGPPPSSAY